jgi:adenine-specific DNA methylase
MDDCVRAIPSAQVWRPIHYLGSKLRVIDAISSLVDRIDPGKGRICDLFAGSGTVSAAIATQRAVTAVDIQEYSRVLCSALLKPSGMSHLEAQHLLRQAANGSFYKELEWAAESLLQYERHSLERARCGRFQEIFDLIEFGPIVGCAVDEKTSRSELRDAIIKTSERLQKLGCASGAPTVVLRHFGGVYFSYSQSIELASLLEVVARCDDQIRHTATAAVLSTASEIVNTVGKQFAQPLKPRDAAGKPKMHLLQKIIRDRSIGVFPVFSEWLERYRNLSHTNKSHRIVRTDYSEALTRHCDDAAIIYADPPYTRDHYSRFYHVLETMCMRDDPVISTSHPSNKGAVGRGVYRLDRHQSPFCIKSQAPKAFARLFDGVRRLGVPLVLSYSPLAQTTKPRPRVIDATALRETASKFFKRVDLVSAGRMSHNKFNSSSMNSEMSYDAELFLVCT